MAYWSSQFSKSKKENVCTTTKINCACFIYNPVFVHNDNNDHLNSTSIKGLLKNKRILGLKLNILPFNLKV